MGNIDAQINEYWGELAYDGKTIDMPSHMEFLKDKYGETLDKFENLHKNQFPLTPEQIKEIYDMEFQTGLYKDYDPIQEYYRREVLKILLEKLQDKTVIDLGCEDGRISLGLALFGNNKVYGIDMNAYAIGIAEKKKAEYPKIIDRLEYKISDYNSSEFHQYIKKAISDGADTVLMVQPTIAWFQTRHKFKDMIKPEGNAIITMMHIIVNENEDMEKQRILGGWGDLARKAGLNYEENFAYTPFYKRCAILVGEMKR